MMGPYALHQILPEDHQRAIYDSIEILTDSFMVDLTQRVRRREDFEPGFMLIYLPDKYRLRYDMRFAMSFFVCFLTVCWKLRAPDSYWPACTAEELALNAILEHGAELIDISRLLGHANITTTADIYGGKLAKSTRRAAESIVRAIEGPEKPLRSPERSPVDENAPVTR